MALKLLVSIRNADEATQAIHAKVDWIDLKEPLAGPLGRPSRETIREVGQVLHHRPERSAALGELHDLSDDEAVYAADWFPYLKVGLSGLSGQLQHPTRITMPWTSRFEELSRLIQQHRSTLIPVLYADYPRCAAPRPSEVLAVAQHLSAPFLLIDTYIKDGRGLLEWLSLEQLNQFQRELFTCGCQIVLAGSVTERDLPKLLGCPGYAVAVRGAVCNASRQGSLDPAKLQHWVTMFRAITSVPS